MSSIPGKVKAPQYVKKKSETNSFAGLNVVSIEFQGLPIRFVLGDTFAVKVMAVKEDGTSQDVTNLSTLEIDDTDVAQVYPGGMILGGTTGLARLTATFRDFSIYEPVIVTGELDFVYFRYVVAANSADFMVSLPEELEVDTYSVKAQLVDSTDYVGIYLPDVLAGDRTTTQFRVVTTSNLSIGDTIDFLIIQ